MDAWRARIAGVDSALPIAGHAVPDATGAAVTSAEHAVAVFRHTTAVAAELRTALAADLRPYQVRGVSWLRETIEAHGGAVLADEMGLGKTLQAIGYLVGRADEGPQVVVCPTSLVGNWAHEIARFAPDLRTMLDIQDFFRVSSGSARVSIAALPQRWIALNVLDPADY